MIKKRLLNHLEYTISAEPSAIKRLNADIRYFQKSVDKLPLDMQKRYARQYATQYHSKKIGNPTGFANRALKAKIKRVRLILSRNPLHEFDALLNDEKRQALALVCYGHCTRIAQQTTGTGYADKLMKAYWAIVEYMKSYGIGSPIKRNCTKVERYEHLMCRLLDDEWWQLKLDRIAAQTLEHIYIADGSVNKHAQAYCSNTAVSALKQQREDNDAFISQTDVLDDVTGERVKLDDVVSKTVANPEKRRIELMVRAKGLEQVAELQDKKALFVTITAPSKYHAISKNYNGATPVKTHRYLRSKWAQFRAAINRKNIDWFGLRTAEPHADATPHWHMLVFVSADDVPRIKSLFVDYFCSDDKDELTAPHEFKQKIGKLKSGECWHDARVKFEDIDASKGSPTAYIAKYISKNVDAAHNTHEMDLETENCKLSDSMVRVLAWSRLWRIRQFQFFGASPVTAWRELRKAANIKLNIDNPALDDAFLAVDSGSWCNYENMLKNHPVFIVQRISENKYGEKVKTLAGFTVDAQLSVITRTGTKRLVNRKKEDERRASSASWTCVNKCTPVHKNTQNTQSKAVEIRQKIKRDNPYLDKSIIERMVSRILESTNP